MPKALSIVTIVVPRRVRRKTNRAAVTEGIISFIGSVFWCVCMCVYVWFVCLCACKMPEKIKFLRCWELDC